MDELMKQAEDHLAKGRVQIATDEAVLGIKRDDLPEEFGRMQWLFREILGALPEKRDWLDPALEKEMKLYGTAPLSSNAAQSAGQEPVEECDEIDQMIMSIGIDAADHSDTKDEGEWGFNNESLCKFGYALLNHFYTHPSSAAQVEEIRNAAIDKCISHLYSLNGWASQDCADRLRALKTAAPSKGEE